MSTTTTQKAFRHIGKEYGAPGGGISAFGGAPDKAPTRRPPPSGWGAPAGGPFGQGTVPQPGGPGGLPPVYDPKGYGGGGSGPQGAPPTEPFQAKRAYDKLLTLTVVTVLTGVVGYVAVPVGLAFVCLVVAFGLIILSYFKVRWSKVIAPAYAVLEGLGLGAISASYATLGHGIVPVAIVFTGAVFVAALALYRTGLVKVTPRMTALAMMGGFGIMIVAGLSLVGLSLPGLNSFGPLGVIIGVVFLAIAVLNLFNDFAFVDKAEAAGLPADAEWSAALAMMTALVLVYISMLRIIASMYGGRR
ncbi:MAG: Bax inhibitor-1/YccA family protein [Actinomycetota bacterium]|nr:Bax inhibitor-1/YccA family protein [Actinomycetota bacterium]